MQSATIVFSAYVLLDAIERDDATAAAEACSEVGILAEFFGEEAIAGAAAVLLPLLSQPVAGRARSDALANLATQVEHSWAFAQMTSRRASYARYPLSIPA